MYSDRLDQLITDPQAINIERNQSGKLAKTSQDQKQGKPINPPRKKKSLGSVEIFKGEINFHR